MRRFPAVKPEYRRYALIVGVFLLVVALILVARLFRSSVSKTVKRQSESEIAKKHEAEVRLRTDTIHEVTIVNPSASASVGGKFNITVRVRTRKASLTGLAVRLSQENPKWPSPWTEFAKGNPPTPERTKTDSAGVTTTVYSWTLDTVPETNGKYVISAESEFALEGDRENESTTVEQRFTVLNLVIESCNPESSVVWKGEEGRKRPITVFMRDNDLRIGPVQLRLRLFPTEGEDLDPNRPIRVLSANITSLAAQHRSLTWTFEWDGKDSSNSYVRPGVYTYEVEAVQESDGDEASYRSGYFKNGSPKPFLTAERARTQEAQPFYSAEFVGERDNGTPRKPEDDLFEYYISYRLSDAGDADAIKGRIGLFNPRLERVYQWNIADLICRAHDGTHDGLNASKRGIQHTVLVRVPKKVMPPDGAYRFVLDFKDDHASRYRSQSSRWSLPVTILAPRYRIEGYTTGQFRVAWCRAEAIDDIVKRTLDVGWAESASRGGELKGKANSGIEGAARLWVMDKPHRILLVKRGTKQISPEVFGTGRGEIRAAINGGLIGLPVMQPVGDLGVGSGWRYFLPSPRAGLWSFSMEASGGGFACAEVEQSPIYSYWMKCKLTDMYHTPKAVKDAYPYGRGAVGLLVKDGRQMNPPPWWPPVVPGAPLSVDLPLQRTAIAFSDDVGNGQRHFFLVSASSCTWSMMADFLSVDGGLASSIRGMLGRKNGYPSAITISRAFMLDGGTSTQFAYRAMDSGGEIVRYPGKSSARDIVLARHNRSVTDIVAVRAACGDLGNHPFSMN